MPLSICLVENLGDVLSDRLARFRRKLLSKLPQFLVLGGCGVESLVRLRHGQSEDIRHRLAAKRWAKKSIAEAVLAFEVSMTLSP